MTRSHRSHGAIRCAAVAAVTSLVLSCDGGRADPARPGPARDGGPPADAGAEQGSTAAWAAAPWREVHRVANALVDVEGAAGDEAWVAGFEALSHHTQGRWEDAPLAEAEVVNGLWAPGPGVVLGAGYTIGLADFPLIVRWDGAALVREVAAGRGQLLAIWGASASDVWAVGAADLVLRRRSDRWEEVDHPAQVFFTDVRGVAEDDVWAVGCALDAARACARSATLHWDGRAWTDVPNPGMRMLSAVWPLGPSEAWAAGSGVTLRWDGRAWADVGTPISGGVSDLFGTGPDDVWAAATFGQLAHWDGRAWTMVSLSTVEPINAVWGSPTGGMWATSSMGLVFHAGP